MSEEPSIFRFGGFELDAGRRRLLGVDDEPVVLKPKTFDLLLCLVTRRGDVVPKRELLAAIWPDTVVEEHSLTQAVSGLRQALGERPGEHRFIATVPGRGYCFVAEVTAASQRDASAGATASMHRRPLLIGAITAGATAVALAVGIWIAAAGVDASIGMKLDNQELISTFPGNHTQPDLSPDGSLVAFVNDVSDTPQIWVKSVAGGEAQPITRMAGGAVYPAWSPRGDEILFHALEGGIWSVGPLGTPQSRPVIDRGRHPRFSADGATIVFERADEIWIADSDGSRERKVSGVPDRRWAFMPAWPALSPDGTQIAFFLQQTGPLGDLWVVPSAGGMARQLTFDQAEMGRPAWAPDGRHILFTSKRAGTRTIWRVAAVGGTPQPVTTGVGEDGDPVISRDGTHLVYTNSRVMTRFILTDPEAGRHDEVWASRNLSWFPRVSPDGRLIAFFSELETREQIFVLNINSGDVRQLTFGTGNEANITPRWHPDGETLFYYENLRSRSLRRLSLDSGRSEEVFGEFAWESNMDVEWSPQGDAIAFVRADPSGEHPRRVVVQQVGNRAETLIDPAITETPSWSADGAYLLGNSENAVWICPVTGDVCTRVVDASVAHDGARVGLARWAHDQSRIYYALIAEDPTMREVWGADPDGNNPRQYFEYGPVRDIAATFEVMPDGRILWTHYDRGDTELWTASIEPSG